MSRSSTQHRLELRRRLQVERLETRRVMAASAMEIYAFSLINEMRADPVGFGNDLQSLQSGTVATAHGYSKHDPVWTDLREAIDRGQFKSNVDRAISRLKSSHPLPPLAWEDSLESKSDRHNEWMRDYCFGHSTPAGSSSSPCFFALPGLTYDPRGAAALPDIISAGTMGPWSDGSFKENIGYQSGPTMPATRAIHAVGSDGHRQRQAYFDVVNYVLEFESPTLGHLDSLLNENQEAIGLDYLLIDGFDPGSSATNYVSTQTLSGNREAGAYLTGLAHQDVNGNGVYDIGEQASGCVSVTDLRSAATDRHCAAASEFGRLSVFLPAGDYVVQGGLTTRTIQIRSAAKNQNVDVTELLNDRRSQVSLLESSTVVSEGAGWAEFVVRRRGALAETASASISLIGTGKNDVSIPSHVTFSAGQEQQTVRVQLIDDSFSESDEQVVLQISQPQGTTSGGSLRHTITVVDDDPLEWNRYQARFVSEVVGQHALPADGQNHVLMFVANSTSTITVNTLKGDHASDVALVVDGTRQRVSSISGQSAQTTVTEGDRYAVVFHAITQATTFEISSSVGGAIVPSLQNVIDEGDVNADGSVTIRDALAIINELSRRGSLGYASDVGNDDPSQYYDVNGDGAVAPRDALAVINELAIIAEQEGSLHAEGGPGAEGAGLAAEPIGIPSGRQAHSLGEDSVDESFARGGMLF